MTQAYPLQWPIGRRRTRFPESSRFKTGMALARDDLMHEIELLGGVNTVLSTNIPVRLDGLPYANHRQPDDKAVAVYFTLKGQSYCFACDKWDKVADNIQAVRHTINALRGIARWGTGDMMQQAFTGFQALPAPTPPHEVLGVAADASHGEVMKAYYEKAKTCHPDKGGDSDEFNRLTEAKERMIG